MPGKCELTARSAKGEEVINGSGAPRPKVYKAFVCSTFKDLRAHRNHVIATLRKSGFFVDPMEEWPVDAAEPKTLSQDRVDGCEVCVLIVGFRRGHVPLDESRSVTQLECQSALDSGARILPFILKEQAPWPREFDELDEDPGVREWREELEEHRHVEYFDHNPESIQIGPGIIRWFMQEVERLVKGQEMIRLQHGGLEGENVGGEIAEAIKLFQDLISTPLTR
jgi:hypothetical protein